MRAFLLACCCESGEAASSEAFLLEPRDEMISQRCLCHLQLECPLRLTLWRNNSHDYWTGNRLRGRWTADRVSPANPRSLAGESLRNRARSAKSRCSPTTSNCTELTNTTTTHHSLFYPCLPPTTSLMSLNEVWEAASASPFEPIVPKDSQFFVGFCLLLLGTTNWPHNS